MIFIFIRENEKEFITELLNKLITVIIDGGKIFFFNIDESDIITFHKDERITFKVTNNEITNIFNVIHRYIDSDIIYEVKMDAYHIKCETSDDLESIIRIEQDNIVLGILSKCDTINTGTYILEQIKKIAKDLKKKTVTLSDDSDIIIGTCRYSLAYYYILLKGESWYNSHGFISTSHNDNVTYNKHIIELSLEQFLIYFTHTYIKTSLTKFRGLYRKIRKLKILDQIDINAEIPLTGSEIVSINEILNIKFPDVNNFISGFKDIIPDINKYTSIQTIIIEINKHIISKKPTLCDDKIILLSELVDMSKRLLKYDNQLTYTVV